MRARRHKRRRTTVNAWLPILAELDRYAVFGHPQAKLWTGENPHDFLVWEDRNLATAAVFGLRFWTTGDRQDAEAFKRLVLGCRRQLDRSGPSPTAKAAST